MDRTSPLEFHPLPRLDPVRVRAAWQRAAPHMTTHGSLLTQAGKLLLERLDDIRITPEHILDLGDRSGTIARHLQERWPKAKIISLTLAEALAQQQRYRTWPWRRRPSSLVADLTQLPFQRGQFDLVISNMALHWSNDLSTTLREIRRVLAADKLLLFTVAGAETLWELHTSMAELDQQRYGRTWERGPTLPALHTLGDALMGCGFVFPVVDRDRASLAFPDIPWLLQRLKGMGAGNHLRVRAKGLMGKGYPQALQQIYADKFRQDKQPLTFSLELLFGQAWKAASKSGLSARQAK